MAKSGNVFDMERLLQYVDFMKENDLTEIDLEQDGQKIRLSRDCSNLSSGCGSPCR